ncbi:hypothetical protein CPLU01_03069 [Colletotrichum plurivorum]|uniref:F-box domain-containing protein n=1 Tax=Colletotrichum plurivorum TaxID=2175906 RepID=A0A8H6KTU5_9PEZI|nr:hypothetical protein CPLU01_03069 [Colletotrichum plurivorum]
MDDNIPSHPLPPTPVPVLTAGSPAKLRHWRLRLAALLHEKNLLKHRSEQAQAYEIVRSSLDESVIAKIEKGGWDASLHCPLDLVTRVLAACDEKCALLAIPAEIKNEITGRLAATDVKALSGTCSYWRDVLTPRMFRGVRVVGHPEELGGQLALFLENEDIIRSLRSFTLVVTCPEKSADSTCGIHVKTEAQYRTATLTSQVLHRAQGHVESFTLEMGASDCLEAPMLNTFLDAMRASRQRHLSLTSLRTLHLKLTPTTRSENRIALYRAFLDIAPVLDNVFLWDRVTPRRYSARTSRVVRTREREVDAAYSARVENSLPKAWKIWVSTTAPMAQFLNLKPASFDWHAR